MEIKHVETEMETSGQLDIETKGVTDGQPEVETDGVTNGVVMQLETGGQQSAEETEQLVTELETGKGKDDGMVDNTEVVGKRLRVPLAYLSSLFMAGVKRRTFTDGS
ncbi:hypothetical protein Adt_38925 [Abeliophyllum distichum]|uniref:Uncharacterized protein n=1 Tax=Abeliophyllum distichum TaxID=126358 RepID=A0ABD1Q4K7_9LAMI